MPFLLGRKTESLSFIHPLSSCPETEPLTDEKLESLKAQLLAGDAQTIDAVYRGYMRLAMSIAGRYAASRPHKIDDLVSEAMYALASAIHEIIAGKMKKDNIPAYITSRIHVMCSDMLRNDRLFGISRRGISYRKKKGLPELPKLRQLDVFSLPSPSRLNKKSNARWVFSGTKIFAPDNYSVSELLEIIELSIKSERQRKIVDLRRQGYKIREISEELGIPTSTVALDLQTVKKEIKRLMET